MLNNVKGVDIPRVGFGTYLIGDKDAQGCVYQAICAGYRHVDTAESYGNEQGVGLGIRQAIRDLGLERHDIHVTTKLWPGNEEWGQEPKTYNTAIDAFNASLDRLELEYVDLYLIHAPFPKGYRLEQWQALVDLQQQGKTRAIGVSNYSKTHIEEILSAGLPLPDADQIEVHPWSQKRSLVSFLNRHAIAVIAYSSLVPLSSWRAVNGQDSAKTEAMMLQGSQLDRPFKIMAEKYDVSEAQVLLRWALQQGYAVLPKSTREERVRDNIDLFSFEIDNHDMDAIAEMDRGEAVAWSSGDPCLVV